jgi:predicted HTH transcriptional regulator
MMKIHNIEDFNGFLDTLLAQSENDELEFKSAAGGFPGSFWDTYSAFANTEGGTIILGVAEKKGEFYLDKLEKEQVERYRKDFWNNINNRTNISCNLLKSDNVQVVCYNGSYLMAFYIPRASREQRPVYRSTSPYNGTFKRNHEGDYKCTEREVQRMFADANVDYPSDSRVLKNYTLNDIDLPSLNGYRQLFKLAKPEHPWLELSDLDLLKKLGGYRKDRATGEEGFTLAGMLMFGKTEAITDPECCSNFFPDYQEILENDGARWNHRICPDGTWQANLYQFYRLVLPRLKAVLPRPFILKDSIRRDETPAHVAVREALINLCIHADYSENASLVVKLYSDKIYFSNPGTMLVSKEQYYLGGESVCRNKTLQNMFMMIGTAEKAGSGVDKILKGWTESNWRTPQLETQCRPDKCMLTLWMESVIDKKVQQILVHLYGETVLGLEHSKLIVMNMACTDGRLTNEDLRFSLNMHRADIGDLLKMMCREGLLVSHGYGRGTYYTLSKEIGDVLPDDYEQDSDDGKLEPDDGKLELDDGKLEADDGKLVKKSERIPYLALATQIKEFCEDWRSISEISRATGKNAKYLINKIIPRMLEDGLLESMFPYTRTNPRQRYKVKE